jgi:two-component system chemotaxis response regulator CheB
MEPIRVLIVDDSAFARDIISAILSTDSRIEVVGEASNGKESIEKVRHLKPDVVTMDINMPLMDGLEAIGRIMAEHPLPILVVTSSTDADLAYKAISRGALEVVSKPSYDFNANREFIRKVKMLSKVRVISQIGAGDNEKLKNNRIENSAFPGWNREDFIVGIASSTGGPKAISVILSMFPEDFPYPVVIAQHISNDFVTGMAEWLDGLSKIKVKIPEEGEKLTGNTIYLSPADKHMCIASRKQIAFQETTMNDIYFPSCDILLGSIADVYGKNTVGVILTGMGNDGVSGIGKIRNAGGFTIAQDEASSVIFGMPKIAIDNGSIDRVLPLPDICPEIVKMFRKK